MKKLKKLNNILIFVFSLTSICLGVYYINTGKIDRLGACFTIPLVFMLSKIANKLFKVNISVDLEFTYILFVIAAQFFGSVIYLYNSIWWYDLLCHFVSGILTSVLALNILSFYDIKPKKKIFNYIFIICFTISIAAIWEYLECLIDILFKTNVQHYIETGTKDTITDMIAGTIGSILFSIYNYNKNKKIAK